MVPSASNLASEKQLLYEQLLDALHSLFGGVHPGYRAIHAKGIVCAGTFGPAATAASVCRARHLQSASTPITVRFSEFAGVPTVPDGDPLASPRGMAIKFHLPAGSTPTSWPNRMTGSRSVPPKNSSFLSTPWPRADPGCRARADRQLPGKPSPGEAVRGGTQTGPGQFRHGVLLRRQCLPLYQPGRRGPRHPLPNPPGSRRRAPGCR